MDPTIYIIIPIYNAEDYLIRCIDSIKNQTYKNFICIMIDDGSADKSNEICKSYTKDERFILLTQKNQGCWAARNIGLDFVFEHAKEDDFLTFVDADDMITNKFFENFILALRNYEKPFKNTIFLSGYNEITDAKITEHKLDKPLLLEGSFRDNFEVLDPFIQTIWANFYNISLMKENNLRFDSTMRRAGDIYFNFIYAYFVKNFVFINECFYNYYEMQSSISHNAKSITEDAFNTNFRSFEKRVQFLTECNIKNKEYIINKHISNIIFKHILAPGYKYLYKLNKHAYSPKFTRTNGQKRVLFCLKHHLLWIYRLYLTMKKS